ncbi:MAG: heme-binding protein, partial [Nitrospira sp.]|nr:heme-binding protein [Nitrospira sp.]
VDSSRKKAYTAASMKRPTGELAELATKMPVIEGIRDMNDHILILGGGLPIILNG